MPENEIHVFMDESNIHDGSDHVTVASAWANISTWNKWVQEWTEAIKPLTLYHSADVHNLDGECKGWTKEARTELVKRAMAVIAKNKIEGRIGHINRHLVERELGGANALKNSPLEHPYFACFIWVIKRTSEILMERGVQRALFFHESNDFSEGAIEHFKIAQRKSGFINFEFSFATKADVVPLQCADVFAYEGMHKVRNWEKPRLAIEAADSRDNRIQILRVTDQQFSYLAELIKAI